MSDLEHMAIQRLQAASEMSLSAYGQPLIVTTSGGKDSSVCVELAQRAGIPFEVMHNHTTADAPETVYFVRREFKRLEEKEIKCTLSMPTYKGKRTSMWNLIRLNYVPPSRFNRYCCSFLKETGGAGRFICTGVRWAESAKRKNNRGIYEKLSADKKKKIILNNDNDDTRLLFENCRLKAKRVVNPIIDWQDSDIWDFLKDAKIPVNPLYFDGFCRVGCVGCPLAGKKKREMDFIRWPKYKNLYLMAFGRMLEARKERTEKPRKTLEWQTPQDVFNWWMDYDILPGQMDLFAEEDDEWED